MTSLDKTFSAVLQRSPNERIPPTPRKRSTR